jgi:hypothetical protein
VPFSVAACGALSGVLARCSTPTIAIAVARIEAIIMDVHANFPLVRAVADLRATAEVVIVITVIVIFMRSAFAILIAVVVVRSNKRGCDHEPPHPSLR